MSKQSRKRISRKMDNEEIRNWYNFNIDKGSRTIYFGPSGVVTTPTSIRTDNDGSFNGASFTVPSVVSGTYAVKVSDGSNELTANFSISTDATLSPTTGNVGTTLTVDGDGFVASGTVTIKYDNTDAPSLRYIFQDL